ncbi:MAG: CoA pyrophosphatase [Flavobacteriales bacterium]|nr:CoA pyrophosphatase [Flavobacteriales bacterium]
MKELGHVLRIALLESIGANGLLAASNAEHAMPFTRPSRAMAEQKGVEIRFAAVLLAIYPMQGSWHALLMQRTKYPGVHSGQVSIPGGEREAVDANLMETARREFEEEVGVAIPSEIIFGPLSERFIPPSRFAVSPYLAILPQRPQWNIDPIEVDSIIEFKVDSLLTDRAMRPVKMEVSPGLFHPMPAYPIQGNEVWGATALILTEFMEHWKQLPEAMRTMQ